MRRKIVTTPFATYRDRSQCIEAWVPAAGRTAGSTTTVNTASSAATLAQAGITTLVAWTSPGRCRSCRRRSAPRRRRKGLVSAVTRTGALGTFPRPGLRRDCFAASFERSGPPPVWSTASTWCWRSTRGERLEVVLDEGVRYVSFSWGVDDRLIGRARERGAVVLVQVGDVAAAVEAAECGADVVIAQGVEAGGHVQGRTPILDLLHSWEACSRYRSWQREASPMRRQRGPRSRPGLTRWHPGRPSSSLMRRTCIRSTSTACCGQPRRTPCSRRSSTSVGRMRLTGSFETTPTPPGTRPVAPTR